MGEIVEIGRALEAGIRSAAIVELFQDSIGRPITEALSTHGMTLLNNHGHAIQDDPDKQFLFAELFRWPRDIPGRIDRVARTKSGARLADGFAYLGFVASQAWTEGRYGAPAHVRWGLFLEADRDREKLAARPLDWLLRQIPDGEARMSVQPRRPIPGFSKGRDPTLWHTWVGREVPSAELAAFTTVATLRDTVVRDLRDIYTAMSAPSPRQGD